MDFALSPYLRQSAYELQRPPRPAQSIYGNHILVSSLEGYLNVTRVGDNKSLGEGRQRQGNVRGLNNVDTVGDFQREQRPALI